MQGPTVFNLFFLTILAFAIIAIDRMLRKGHKKLKAMAKRAEGTPVCPSCMRPTERGRNFCPHCNMPLTGYAAIGPVESIAAQGELYRRGAAHPTVIVLIGF